MSSPLQRPRSAADEEKDLLDAAGEIMEKSGAVAPAVVGEAAAVPSRRDFVHDDPDRLEDRVPPSPDEGEEEEEDEGTKQLSSEWGYSPSVRDQAERHPDTVRWAEPETRVFNIGDADQLKQFNEIQKGSADHKAPTHAISEIDKTTIPGSWVVTFYRIQYQKL